MSNTVLYAAFSRGRRLPQRGLKKGRFLACASIQCVFLARSATVTRMAAVAHVTGTDSASSTSLSRKRRYCRTDTVLPGTVNVLCPILKQSVMVTLEGPSVTASASFTIFGSGWQDGQISPCLHQSYYTPRLALPFTEQRSTRLPVSWMSGRSCSRYDTVTVEQWPAPTGIVGGADNFIQVHC